MIMRVARHLIYLISFYFTAHGPVFDKQLAGIIEM